MSIKPQRQAGLTLVELILFIVIVGVALVGFTTVYTYTSTASADPLRRKQAMLLAEALIEEVSLARFTFCHPNDAKAETATSSATCATMRENFGPQGGEARPFFNINDYVAAPGIATSFTASDPGGGISDVNGSAIPAALASYKAKVTIRPVAAFGPAGLQIGEVDSPPNNDANTDVLHISVNVTYDNGQSVVLDRYRTRYAPNSMP